METETKTEWAIRTSNDDGSYTYHTMYQPGWGTRFQGIPKPYTLETANEVLKHSNQFARMMEPVIVSRETVTVASPWTKAEPVGIPSPEISHVKYIDIDWAEDQTMRSYTPIKCNCTTPWRHYP